MIRTQRQPWGWIAGLALTGCAAVATPSDAGRVDVPGNDTVGVADAGVDRPEVAPREGPIVINEVSAGATSWIELYNDSDETAELGSQLLRSRGDTSGSYLLVTKGGSLAPRQFAVIALDPPDPARGSRCEHAGGAPMLCFSGGFPLDGVQSGSITVMRFAGAALEPVDYPAGLAASAAAWGRTPDGSGDFVLTRPTPGAPNARR